MNMKTVAEAKTKLRALYKRLSAETLSYHEIEMVRRDIRSIESWLAHEQVDSEVRL